MHSLFPTVFLVFPLVSASILSEPVQLEPLSLQGHGFTCCTVTEYPISYKDNTSRPFPYTGIAFEYLARLRDRLGFYCDALYEYSDNDTSFSSFIKTMERCDATPSSTDEVCKCTLGVGGWMTMSDRIDRVNFLPDFVRYEVDFLTHRGNTYRTSDGIFFLTVFTPFVWFLIFLIFALFTFVRLIDVYFMPPATPYEPLAVERSRLDRTRHFFGHSSLWLRLRDAAIRTALELTGQVDPNAGLRRNTVRQCMLTFGVILTGLFFMLTFEASMTASLVVGGTSGPYTNREDIINCRVNRSELCIPSGGAEASGWRNLIARSNCTGEPQWTTTYDETIEAVRNKTCKFALLGSTSSRDATTGRDCANFERMGAPVFYGGVAFVMPLSVNRTVYDILRNTTLDVVEQGKVPSIAEHFTARGQCFQPVHNPISFEMVEPFFTAATVFSLVVFAAMVLHPRGD